MEAGGRNYVPEETIPRKIFPCKILFLPGVIS